jgi:hypothetical protein
MAALSLLTGSVATAPKCVIGIPLIGVCIGATAEPSPAPTTSPPIAPAPSPAPAPVTPPSPAPAIETAQPVAPAPTQQWQSPPREVLTAPVPVTKLPPAAPEPTGTPWSPEPSQESVATGPAEGTPTPVSRPSTAAASAQPEAIAPSASPVPIAEQASRNTKGIELNAVLIGTVLAHLGIALIWFSLFILPALWSGAKTVVVREVREPRHLSPRRDTP